MFPKLKPSTETAIPPVDALQATDADEIQGKACPISRDSEETALKATLRASIEAVPFIDARRHNMLVSLIQMEPAHEVAARRAAGEDATFAKA